MKRFFTLFFVLTGFIGIAFSHEASAQCTITDPKSGNPTRMPNGIFNCIASGQDPTYKLDIRFTNPVTNVAINWGDGSEPQTFTGQVASHTYTSAGKFIYTITGCGDPIEGLLASGVDDGSVPGMGFSGPPAGPTNLHCLPATLEFKLTSMNMDEFDQFKINWGDGKDTIVDIRANEKPIFHTYSEDLEKCLVEVNVTYKNACGNNPPDPGSVKLENSLYFITKEKARAQVDTVVICGPMDITIKDNSVLNACVENVPREIKWTALEGLPALPFPGNDAFRDYANSAHRSITIPADHFTNVPADSVFKIMLAIQNRDPESGNICNYDEVDVPIIMVKPVQPSFTMAADTVCPGSPVLFTNHTSKPGRYPELQMYEWNWGDGSAPQIDSGYTDTLSHVFAVGGTYKVTLYSVVNTSDGQSCKLPVQKTIVVRNALSPLVEVTPNIACDSAEVIVKNKSINTENVKWLGWGFGGNIKEDDGPNFLPREGTYTTGNSGDPRKAIITKYDDNGELAVKIKYPTWGRYIISVKAQTGDGQSGVCSDPVSGYDTVHIYPSPQIRWRLTRKVVCLGQALESRDSSMVELPGDNRGLPGDMRHLTWTLDFGDGPESVFTSNKPITENQHRADITGRLNSYTYTKTGTYLVKLTVNTPYCSSTVTKEVVVQNAAQPEFEYVQNECDASRITFINKTVPVEDTYYMWIVRRNGYDVDTIIRNDSQPFDSTFSYLSGATTNYDVLLIAVTGSDPNACRIRTAPQTIQIPPVTKAYFDFAGAAVPGCSPMAGLQFVDKSFYVPDSSTYFWDFDNGKTLENKQGDAVYAPGYENNSDTVMTYRAKLIIKYKAPDTCSFSYERDIIVYPDPKMDIFFPDIICSGQPVTFAVKGNSLNNSTLAWKFSDNNNIIYGETSVQRSIINNTANSKSYTVTLTGRNIFGCYDSVTKEFVVKPAPKPAYTRSDSIGCSPLAITFSNVSDTSSPAFRGPMTYVWDYGDGSKPDTVKSKVGRSHTFVNYGNAEVFYTTRLTMISPNGCSEIVQKSIVVKPEVKADIALSNPNGSAGCSPHTISIINISSQREGLTYEWFFSDPDNPDVYGDYNLSGPVTFRNYDNTPVTYTAKLRVSSPDCFKEDSVQITVYPEPKPQFDITSPNPTQMPENTVKLRNTTPAMDNWSYVWYFGNGDSLVSDQKEISYTYSELEYELRDSLFTITLKATGPDPYFCHKTFSRELKIRPIKPVADFEVVTEPSCVPHAVTFNNLSKYGNSDGYFWNFGDGNTSRLTNPVHSYTVGGEYDVTLTVKGIGGQDVVKKEKIVVVYDVPSIAIQTVPRPSRILRIPSEVLNCFAIINLEDTAETYLFEWDFGDGTKSYEKNPVHKYTDAGTYVVTLKTTTSIGCSSIQSDTIRVEFEEGRPVLVPNAFSPNIEGPNRTRIDPSQPAPGNDIFYPVAIGASEVKLQIFNRWGQIIFESNELGYGWDGYHNGSLCQQDVYIYKLLVIFPDGRRTRKMGDVTLVR
jgi:PKD repeat protein